MQSFFPNESNSLDTSFIAGSGGDFLPKNIDIEQVRVEAANEIKRINSFFSVLSKEANFLDSGD